MSRIGLNTNLFSINAQRQVATHTSALRSNFERLSSGLRINKASDDAAGLAVSSLLNLDKQIANQSIRNINDGISYLNVAEGALNELSNIVQRISELAEQSANGTIGNSQRQALQQEVTALQSEYNRIIETTEFNNKQILTGEDTNTVLQGGYGTDGQLSINIGLAALSGAPNLSAGETIRVSTTSTGAEGNNLSFARSISGDGRYVVIESDATNFVAGDTNGLRDAFVKDNVTGELRLASSSSAGVIGNAISFGSAMTSDGRYVLLNSDATNFIASDLNGVRDAFVKDMQTGEINIASTSSAGVQANATSAARAMSEDGRYVLIASSATNLVAGDTNGVGDVFVKDMVTGTMSLVSTSSSGVQGNASSTLGVNGIALSADGRYAVFESDATNLVSGDTNGVTDVFMKDLVTGVTTRISTDSSGTQGNSTSGAKSISADGKFAIFNSLSTNLVSGDTNGVQDAFLKNLETGETTRISTDSDGNQSNATSSAESISSDGRYVLMGSSASNLVSGDTNGVEDAFRKDILTGEIIRVSVSTTGTEAGSTASAMRMSADGRYATFYTDSNAIVSGDTNGFTDGFLRDLSVAGVQQLSGMVVSNEESARVTLELARNYLDQISQYKAGIGAGVSRASTFISTLASAKENYDAAYSQITDLDVAQESAKLLSNSILQKAAQGVLTNANKQPRIVLSLLTD